MTFDRITARANQVDGSENRVLVSANTDFGRCSRFAASASPPSCSSEAEPNAVPSGRRHCSSQTSLRSKMP